MRLLGQANRIRLFNAYLGTNSTDLSSYPVDFVDAVCAWQTERETRK